MRTTLTLDPDVAAMVERLRKERNQSLKQIVNEGLRQGLHRAEIASRQRKPYKVTTLRSGRCLLDSLDNTAEVLALIESEGFK